MAEERKEIEIGDYVWIGKEKNFLTVKDISSQTVTIGQNKFILKQLYFKEKHQPEFDWRVKKVHKRELGRPRNARNV